MTSNRQSFVPATRICLLFVGDLPGKKKNPGHCTSSRRGTSEIECVHLHSYHPSQNPMPFHRQVCASYTAESVHPPTQHVPQFEQKKRSVTKSIFATSARSFTSSCEESAFEAILTCNYCCLWWRLEAFVNTVSFKVTPSVWNSDA